MCVWTRQEWITQVRANADVPLHSVKTVVILEVPLYDFDYVETDHGWAGIPTGEALSFT